MHKNLSTQASLITNCSLYGDINAYKFCQSVKRDLERSCHWSEIMFIRGNWCKSSNATLHRSSPYSWFKITNYSRFKIIEKMYNMTIHRVSKNLQTYFCQNFVKFRPIAKISGTEIAKKTSFSEVYSFSTSPNLCQHTTVLNADVLNCYIVL